MNYEKNIKKRQEDRIASIRLEAIEKARQAAQFLKEQYRVKRVLLFGSLVNSTYLHSMTDIDLMVEGLEEESFLAAGAQAWKITTPYHVDIIPFEKADKQILERAEEEGIEL